MSVAPTIIELHSTVLPVAPMATPVFSCSTDTKFTVINATSILHELESATFRARTNIERLLTTIGCVKEMLRFRGS